VSASGSPYAVAEVNKCAYCLSAHTYVGSHLAKIDEAELDAAAGPRARTGNTEAILQLAAAVVRDRGEISDRAVRAGGGRPGSRIRRSPRTVGHVAVNVLTNLFKQARRCGENDWPVVTPYPHAA
jgi:AhpD family alkylhydroperoxidase